MVFDLKPLQVGQAVSLEYLEFSCRINVLPPTEAGKRVSEVGADYVVLDDEAEGISTRIPIHFISAIQTPSEPAPQAA